MRDHARKSIIDHGRVAWAAGATGDLACLGGTHSVPEGVGAAHFLVLHGPPLLWHTQDYPMIALEQLPTGCCIEVVTSTKFLAVMR